MNEILALLLGSGAAAAAAHLRAVPGVPERVKGLFLAKPAPVREEPKDDQPRPFAIHRSMRPCVNDECGSTARTILHLNPWAKDAAGSPSERARFATYCSMCGTLQPHETTDDARPGTLRLVPRTVRREKERP